MGPAPSKTKALSIADKWQLLKPMISRYMVPLCKCLLIPPSLAKLLTKRSPSFCIPSKSSNSLFSIPFIASAFLEVRIHHQPRRCAYTCLSRSYTRIISSFWARYSFHSGLLSSLAGAPSSILLSAFLNPPWLACLPKHCISIPFIPLSWAACSPNTRNPNTLNHTRAPFDYTCIGISVGIFS